MLVSGLSPESEICLACFSNIAASDSAPLGRSADGAGYLLGDGGDANPPCHGTARLQKGSRPPSEAWGWASVSVMIITIDYYHNNRIFHKNTSSPTDYFASCSSVPSGGGTVLPVSGCAWGRRCSRREMLLLLLVVLAESIAQLLHFSFFPFFLYNFFFFFLQSLMFIGEMSKMCPSVQG